MADLKKFLDQSGVSTLWTRVAEEVAKVDNKVAGHETRLATAEGKIEALEKGTYDDTAVRELISDNSDAIAQNVIDIASNKAAIDKLNGSAETVGSVANTATSIAAAKVAEIVANADADFDTLKEIADWILNDTTGAADMANDIATLQGLVGDKAVATQISEAIAAEGLDKYALASDLNSLADRVKAIEDAGYQNAEQVGSAIDAKIAALNLATTYEKAGEAAKAESNAKAYADGLAVNYDPAGEAAKAEASAKAYADGLAVNYDVAGAAATAEANAKAYANGLAVNYDAAGSAATAEANAKAYTDSEINTKIIALTPAEIDAVINAAKAQAQA